MLAVTILLVATLLSVGGHVLQTAADQLEREFVGRGAQRVQNALAYRLGILEQTARDCANWNDTVAYIAGDQPSYPDLNFTSTTIANLRVALMLIAGPDRQAVGGMHAAPAGWCAAGRRLAR